MININSLTKTEGFYFNTGDISICRRKHRQISLPLSTNIKTHMIMIGTKFTEISSHAHGYTERVAKIFLWIIFYREKLGMYRAIHNQQKYFHKNVLHYHV